jgi:hypothetical protein
MLSKSYLTDSTIKQLYFYTDKSRNPNGVYGYVDVLEFARIVEQYVIAQSEKKPVIARAEPTPVGSGGGDFPKLVTSSA